MLLPLLCVAGGTAECVFCCVVFPLSPSLSLSLSLFLSFSLSLFRRVCVCVWLVLQLYRHPNTFLFSLPFLSSRAFFSYSVFLKKIVGGHLFGHFFVCVCVCVRGRYCLSLCLLSSSSPSLSSSPLFCFLLERFLSLSLFSVRFHCYSLLHRYVTLLWFFFAILHVR